MVQEMEGPSYQRSKIGGGNGSIGCVNRWVHVVQLVDAEPDYFQLPAVEQSDGGKTVESENLQDACLVLVSGTNFLWSISSGLAFLSGAGLCCNRTTHSPLQEGVVLSTSGIAWGPFPIPVAMSPAPCPQ